MIEKFMKKEMLKVLALKENEIETIFSGQLDSEMYKTLLNNEKLSIFLIDLNMLTLLEDWLEIRETLTELKKRELIDLLDLNYKY